MKKILLTDDEEMVRYALCKYLRGQGYDVTEATNGKEALDKLGKGHFDLLVTDIIMPEVEGMGVIMEIIGSDNKIPIIAMSGGGRIGKQEYLSSAKSLGADMTMEKPLDIDELGRNVESLIGKAEPAS